MLLENEPIGAVAPGFAPADEKITMAVITTITKTLAGRVDDLERENRDLRRELDRTYQQIEEHARKVESETRELRRSKRARR